MGKQVAQGTKHESHIVKMAQVTGRRAMRQPKRAQKHEPDVIIDGWGERLPAVFFKNYYKQEGKKNRGSTSMVILREKDFWKLYGLDTGEEYGIVVQAKAAERINIRTVLTGLVNWIGEYYGRSIH